MYYHRENITVLQDKYHFPPKRVAKPLGLRAVRYLSMCFSRSPPATGAGADGLYDSLPCIAKASAVCWKAQ